MPIAKCLIAIGRAAESDEYLCRAFEVDPTSLGATLAISNLLTKHGEPKRALSFIERHREAVQERNRELAELQVEAPNKTKVDAQLMMSI